MTPPEIRIEDLTRHFGPVRALTGATTTFRSGRLHALLGENGAGKSTLVKCLMGYHRADAGRILIDGTEAQIARPQDAGALGLGMVYQHFTLSEPMTVAENLVLTRADLPTRIDWPAEETAAAEFMARMPFQLDPARAVATLSAGEKQKLEIQLQLYQGRRFLVLDEPTSVLTPQEADEMLSRIRKLCDDGALTAVLITHKFREVEGFAHDVTVLRAGEVTGQAEVAGTSRDDLHRMVFGAAMPALPPVTAPRPGAVRLVIDGLAALDDRGHSAVDGCTLTVNAGEILGVAGVSGNGQKELVEVLADQRRAYAGRITVNGETWTGTRSQFRRHAVNLLAEEPLANCAVRSLSVARNLALRRFDRAPLARFGLLRPGALRHEALSQIADYRIRTPGPDARLETLSGGNVQRVVLARELADGTGLLIAQNPCFGLDAVSTADIRSRILKAREDGAAVLLISEDLDEVLALSDRVAVISRGRIAHHATRATADRAIIGKNMMGEVVG